MSERGRRRISLSVVQHRDYRMKREREGKRDSGRQEDRERGMGSGDGETKRESIRDVGQLIRETE